MPTDMLLDNSINLVWSFFAVQTAMNGIARELVFAGVDTVVHERLGPPTAIGGVACSAVAGHTPRKKWVDFGLKLLRATTTHSDGPQRLKLTALA